LNRSPPTPLKKGGEEKPKFGVGFQPFFVVFVLFVKGRADSFWEKAEF